MNNVHQKENDFPMQIHQAKRSPRIKKVKNNEYENRHEQVVKLPLLDLNSPRIQNLQFQGPENASARLREYKYKREALKRKEFEEIVMRANDSVETQRLLDLYDGDKFPKPPPKKRISPRYQKRINRIITNDRIGQFYQ